MAEGGIKKWVESIRRHSALAGLVAVVVIAASWALMLRGGSAATPQMPVSRAYFVDVQDGSLFAAADEVPPIDTKRGDGSKQPSGVRAYVYACGSCANEKDRYIGFLHKYSDARRPVVARAYADARGKWEELPLVAQRELIQGAGSLVKRLDDKAWVEAGSDEGQKLIAEARSRCESPETCLP